MSQFSESFAPVFAASVLAFGESCRINGRSYPCVVHNLDLSTEIAPGVPGKRQVAEGTIVMSRADVLSSGLKKGDHLAVGGGTFRVTNDPKVGFDSSSVTLQLSPLL